jgi:hypothetical protein
VAFSDLSTILASGGIPGPPPAIDDLCGVWAGSGTKKPLDGLFKGDLAEPYLHVECATVVSVSSLSRGCEMITVEGAIVGDQPQNDHHHSFRDRRCVSTAMIVWLATSEGCSQPYHASAKISSSVFNSAASRETLDLLWRFPRAC